MESITALLTFILKGLWAPILAGLGWMWKEHKKEMKETQRRFDNVEDRVLTVEHRYVTEDRTREIWKEMVGEMRNDMASIKNSLAVLSTGLQDLRTDLAVSKAVQEALDNRRHKPYREE